MHAGNYQEVVKELQKEPIVVPEEVSLLTDFALGLNGEAGEVADVIKKYVFHGHPLDEGHLEEELGDVLWYIAAICNVAGLDMDTVLSRNIEKLRDRYPNGFRSSDSINRKENK